MGLAWQCRGFETSDAGVHQFTKDIPHNIHQLRKRRTDPPESSIFSTAVTAETIIDSPTGMSIVQTLPRYRPSANAVKEPTKASGEWRLRLRG